MEWNSNLYDDKHGFIRQYGTEMIHLLHPGKNESILDLGCGTGDLTAQIAEAADVVIGLDSSENMIGKARQKYPSLRFEFGDIRTFSLDMEFDAIFSNAVLHWLIDPEAAIRNISRHLKPGGRLVVEFGGKGCNEKVLSGFISSMEGMKHPRLEEYLYFPSIGQYTPLLEKYGFEVAYAVLFDRPTTLDGGVEGLKNFAEMFFDWLFMYLTPEEKEEVMRKTENKLREERFVDGSWIADYRRIRLIAVKKT